MIVARRIALQDSAVCLSAEIVGKWVGFRGNPSPQLPVVCPVLLYARTTTTISTESILTVTVIYRLMEQGSDNSEPWNERRTVPPRIAWSNDPRLRKNATNLSC